MASRTAEFSWSGREFIKKQSGLCTEYFHFICCIVFYRDVKYLIKYSFYNLQGPELREQSVRGIPVGYNLNSLLSIKLLHHILMKFLTIAL